MKRTNTGRPARVLRPLAFGTLAGLAVQFLLGMSVNLFVTVPSTGAGARDAAHGSGVPQVIVRALGNPAPLLRSYVELGLLICAAACVTLIAAVRAREKVWLWAAALGLLGILSAIYSGTSSDSANGYLTATRFQIATGSYAAGLYLTRRRLSVRAAATGVIRDST